jgi:ABC-type multidrug transport system ATPase subunit
MSQFNIQHKQQRKQFKPSNKKKIQLTFENLTVKTIPKRKKVLFCEYGEPTQSKIILDNMSGTICPGQFVAMLGSSGKFS